MRPVAAVALAFALLATGCGAHPEPAPPVAEPLAPEAIAALDPDGQLHALDRIEQARRARPHDARLQATEGHLRLALGDWSGAADHLLTVLERGEATPADEQAAWRAVRAAGAWTRWRDFAEARGDARDEAPSPALARWAIAQAGDDRDSALVRLRRALEQRAGDVDLLIAAAAIEGAAGRWGPAGLFVELAVADADTRRQPPPPPALTLRAMVLAERSPSAATAAFEAARGEGDPIGRLAEARFLLAHGRPRAARALLSQWLETHPLDAAAAVLADEIAVVVARVRAGEVTR